MIKIYTIAFNKPEFLTYQLKTFSKFLKEEFRLVCINNAKDPLIRNQITDVCLKNNITYYVNPVPDHTLEGLSHQSALNWAYHTLIENSQEYSIIIDHDLFMFKPFSITSLKEAWIAGVPQSRGHITYMSPALVFLNLPLMQDKNLIDFTGNKVDNIQVDIGGHLHYYLEKYQDQWLALSERGLYLESGDFPFLQEYNYEIPFLLVQDSFIHYRIGSNWANNPEEVVQKREHTLFTVLNYYLNV